MFFLAICIHKIHFLNKVQCVFDKCIVMYAQSSITEKNFTTLKNPSVSPIQTSYFPLANTKFFKNHLYSFVFYRQSYNWNYTVHSLFRLAFFTLTISIWNSSTSFSGWIANFFLFRNNIPLYGCATFCHAFT